MIAAAVVNLGGGGSIEGFWVGKGGDESGIGEPSVDEAGKG